MILVTDGHDFHYETANVCRLFVPHEKIVTVSEKPPEAVGLLAYTRLTESADGAEAFCELTLDEYDQTRTAVIPRESADDRPYRDRCELTLATLLYHLLCDLFGQAQSWGVLTGVRPVKVLRQAAARVGEDAALRMLMDEFLVQPDKCRLAQRVLHAENECLELSRPESCSLYISIPFCPTRCDYCSFVSHTTERSAALIPEYVELLQRELRATADIIAALGLRLETVYMGGGTPTSLSAEQ
ncbi:MAG: coproporphyrinogen dehydrogenase HemZ, partial [Clostridia bacterium]|nr:coproporphyrinogen dehydrogenase HemZ [Clostridia bacterium]